MGKIDSFASQATLRNGPGNVEHDEKVRPGGVIDCVGTKAAIKTEPSSNMFASNGRQVESFATDAGVTRTPIKGWQSTPKPPMSDRAVKQSK